MIAITHNTCKGTKRTVMEEKHAQYKYKEYYEYMKKQGYDIDKPKHIERYLLDQGYDLDELKSGLTRLLQTHRKRVAKN